MKMKVTGDYHTHTIYSHGTGTIRDNVEAAIDRGLKEIAICDHGPGHKLYGVDRNEFANMRREIDGLNKEYKEINILFGVEANLIGFNGILDIDGELLEMIDILLLGFHYGIIPRTLKDGFIFFILNPLSKGLPFLRKKMKDLATNAVIKAMEKYPVDLITHPGSKVKLDIKKLGEEAYKNGTALEINSHHSQLSIENIEIALQTDVEFYINSDAHDPIRVGDCGEGIERALKTKVPISRIKNVESLNLEVEK